MKICLTCQRCYEDDFMDCETEGHGTLREWRRGSRVIDDTYRLDRLLGAGSMGAVYAGTHTELERLDAVKLLQMDFLLEQAKRAHPELLTDPQALEDFRGKALRRFQTEAKAAAQLNHLNVVRIYHHRLLPGNDAEAYIGMELVDGPSLQKYMSNQGQLPLKVALSIARQIADGVSSAHRKQILHRDLKPANIMLVPDEDSGELQAKVVDFGLAKVMEEAITGGALTSAGTIIGTPYYMSPEQCNGHELDLQSDVYSLGVILFEMLAGRRPFEGPNATVITLKHITEQAPSLRHFRPDVPQRVEQFVAQLLRKTPSERTKRAGEVTRLLRELEDSVPTGGDAGRHLEVNANINSEASTITKEIDPAAGLREGGQLEQLPAVNQAGALTETLVDHAPAPVSPQPIVKSIVGSPLRGNRKVRIYDLAKELKLNSKRLIEEIRREGVDVSLPSNTVSKELAEKIRNRYFPAKELPVRPRVVHIAKKEPALPSDDFDFEAILAQYEQEQAAFQEGTVVRGTVVGINDRGVLIDFGFKSEGLVDQQEFTENGELTVKRGDEVEVLIKSMESQEGQPILSRADAVRMRAWDELEKAHRDGTPIKGRILERVKGGLRVDVDGVDAFLPGSQVDSRPIRNLESFRGQEIEAKVIKLNRKRSNVVLSRKAILDEQQLEQLDKVLGNLEEGIIVEGQIKHLTDYGAFVDLGGIDGLLHIHDMSWKWLQSPAELFRVGEIIQAKVLTFDREAGRVSLGYKQLEPDPWDAFPEQHYVGQKVSGRITKVVEFGAFVELEAGVEGLLHVSKIGQVKGVQHPTRDQLPALISPGDDLVVTLINIDPESRRVSLAIEE